MRAVGVGVVLMLFGLAVLFAMVVRALDPGLFLALAAFAALFVGMLVALLQAGRRSR